MAGIAQFCLDPKPGIPEPALRMAATLLLDTIGVAAGAKALEVGQIMRDFVVDHYGPGSPNHAARLMFDGRRSSMVGAAYAIASQIDNLDAHDGLNATLGHIGCAVVPSLFALAEQMPDLTGRAALEAMVIAYEVAGRAGPALHATVSDYHTSGAWNALGVAAMACRLLGADQEQLRQALGIAEYHGPRSQMMREIDNPTMLHDGSGPGAMVGLTAALTALRGFKGAPAITVEADEVAHLWADLGAVWTIEQNYIKPYPICRWAHGAIEAARLVRNDHALHPDQIEHCQINTFDKSAKLFAGMPQTTSQAQYSLAFAVATMLAHGRIGPEHVSGAGLEDPTVIAMIERISVLEEPRHTERFPDGRWSDLTITLKSGKILHSGDVNARGGPEAPMTMPEIEQKFMAFAACAVAANQANAIWQAGQNLLEPSSRFRSLADMIMA